MAQINVQPLVLKDALMTIGTDSFEKAIAKVVFTPKSSTIAFHGLTPDSAFTDVSSAEWTCDLDYVQDWDTTGSLSRYLYTNEGETVAATFAPRNGTGPSFTANLVITPGAIGGQTNAYATTSVSLGSDRPVLVEDES